MTGPPTATDEELALAERHLAEAEERCARQAALLAQLIAHDHPRAVPLAERLLAALIRRSGLAGAPAG